LQAGIVSGDVGERGPAMAPASDPDGSPLRVFGAMLRFYRTKAAMSQDQLGARAYCSGDLVGKVENGERTPTREFTAACDAVTALKTDGALTMLREQLMDNLRRQAYPGWFHRWPDAEAQARALRWYEPLLVPGLLQTEGYARAVLRGAQADASDDQIERQVAARLARQDILSRDNPPHLWVVIDEGVLHRIIGDAKVMHDQLVHLAEMSHRPKVSVQVVPFDAGARTGLLGAFILADQDGAGGILYLETATTGQVAEAPSIVSDAGLIFDTLRSEALPRGASRDVIMKVAETHGPERRRMAQEQ
jgi:transcriptional regulator with XRE-family HTH domain